MNFRQEYFYPGLVFAGLMSTLVLALGLTMLPQSSLAQTTVTPDTLRATLRAAAPGAVLDLVGGDYGRLTLDGTKSGVVLRSADPGNRARFSAFLLQNVDGVTFENLIFDYVFTPGDRPNLSPFQILASNNVTIRGAVFDGDVARDINAASDGFGTALGLGITDSAGIVLEDSDIHGFLRGLVVSRSRDINIRSNDLYALRSDGMDFAQVEDVVIAGNHIHDFAVSDYSDDHADMIQFWTNGTDAPSRNILISDNILNSGEGRYTQSIFMRNDQVDRGLAGDEMFYRNITIENNVILNAHLHGITVGETDGLIIRNNTVVRNATSAVGVDNFSVTEPRINVAKLSRRVEIVRNVARDISQPNAGADWRVADNLMVQDEKRGAPGFYGTVFVDAAQTDPQRLTSFAPRPGGPLDGTGLGAPRLR